jgi:hypothetical protein
MSTAVPKAERGPPGQTLGGENQSARAFTLHEEEGVEHDGDVDAKHQHPVERGHTPLLFMRGRGPELSGDIRTRRRAACWLGNARGPPTRTGVERSRDGSRRDGSPGGIQGTGPPRAGVVARVRRRAGKRSRAATRPWLPSPRPRIPGGPGGLILPGSAKPSATDRLRGILPAPTADRPDPRRKGRCRQGLIRLAYPVDSERYSRW